MDPSTTAAEFERHRGHLVAVAYRMLGTLADAEDAVQETYLRFAKTDRSSVRDARAWLTTTIARICLDQLGSARARRETYVGPWLPEPAVGAGSPAAFAAAPLGPEDRVTLDESVSMAMLVLLESLRPAERTAFVLHEVLGLPYDEIAGIVGRSEVACRQLVARARTRVRDRAFMSALAYTRTGSGEPMVLLHGLGPWRHAWDPVLPALAERFDVIAIDLPGFGDSDQLPAGADASPAGLAAAVGGLLDELGVTAPHIAGNSLGGWVALELARIRQPASVTLLSPAGLWRGRIPLYCLASLWASRWLCKHAEGLLYHVVGHPLGRIVVLGQTHGRPVRMSPGRARATIRAMATCPGFDAAMRATTAVPYRAAGRSALRCLLRSAQEIFC